MVIPTFLISANIHTMGQCQLRALDMGCCAQGHSPAQAWPTSSMRLGLPSSPLQPPPLPGPSLPHHPGAAHADELTSSQASLSTSQPPRGGHCPCSQQPEGHSWSTTHCEGTRVLLLTPADPCTNRQPGPMLHTGHKHRPRALCCGQPWLPATPPIHAEGIQLKAGCRHPQHWACRRAPSVRPLAQAPPPLGSPPRLSQPPSASHQPIQLLIPSLEWAELSPSMLRMSCSRVCDDNSIVQNSSLDIERLPNARVCIHHQTAAQGQTRKPCADTLMRGAV